MTIEYKDSKRIVGLSSDVVQTASFDFNFSSTPTGWTELDSSKMGITGNQFHAKSISDNSNDTVYVSVGDLGDDWIIRMKAQTVGFNNISSGGLLYIGLVESGDETDTWIDTNNLGIFIGERYGDGSNLGGRVVEGGSITTGGTTWGSSSTYIDMADNSSTVYLELKLVGGYSSGTFSATTYTDETYSTVYSGGNNGANTNSITVGNASPSNTSSNLTYLVFKNPTDGSTGSTSNYVEFNFDDLKIYKESSLTSKPTDVQDNSILVEKDTARRYWFESELAPTYEDDTFSSNWTSTGSKVVTGTNVIDWDGIQNGSVNGISKDLQDSDALGSGNNASDTSWVLRATYTLSNLTSPSSASNQLFIGLSDQNHSTSGTSNQDGIVFYVLNDASSASNLFRISYGDGSSLNSNSQDFAETVATGTRYIELKRTATNEATCAIYSDATYETLVELETFTIPTSIIDLRYITVKMRSSSAVGGTFNGTIDDVEFYNGVTSPDKTWSEEGT